MDEEEIKYFVRIRNTDLDGTKAVQIALTGIKGIGPHTSQTISQLAAVDARAIMGRLDDDSVARLADAVEAYTATVPTWMVNRPKDIYTGESKHLLGNDLVMMQEEDINRMRKIRCYRGIRHETGQKVRGQRTKSTGRTGTTVGVKRKKA